MLVRKNFKIAPNDQCVLVLAPALMLNTLFFFVFFLIISPIIPFPGIFCQRHVHPATFLPEKQAIGGCFQMWSKRFRGGKWNHLRIQSQPSKHQNSFGLALKQFIICHLEETFWKW